MKNKVTLALEIAVTSLFVFPLLKENVSTLTIILTALLTLTYLILNKKKILIDKNLALYSIPFFIILATNLFAIHAEIDWKNISRSLLFLIIPISICNIPNKLFQKLEDNYIYYFKYSCFLIALFYLGFFLMNHPFRDFFKENYNESVFRRFIYNDISIFKIHPTYFSLFLNLGVVHSLIKLKIEKKLLNITLFIFFIIMILLLSSKVIIVITIISTLYVIFKSNTFKKRYTSAILILFITGIFFLPGIKSRFVEMIQDYKNPPAGLYFNSTNIRKSIFDCSITILKENYITGVGFSNVQDELNNCYKKNYDSSFFENHDYLTHNYYLYIFIGSGIIGFIFFIFYLINIMRKCIVINNPILNVIIFSSITLCFFEDFLYRHYGLLFFNLFVFSYFKFYENNNGKSILNKQ